MACGCRGGTSGVLIAGQSAAQPLAQNSNIEYVVLYPDGSYSDPQVSMQAAFELAANVGGQARARAKTSAAV